MSIASFSTLGALGQGQVIPCPRGQHEECAPQTWIEQISGVPRRCQCVRDAVGWTWGGGPMVPRNVVGSVVGGVASQGGAAAEGLPWWLDPFGLTAPDDGGVASDGGGGWYGTGIGQGRATVLDPLGLFPDRPQAAQGGIDSSLIIAGLVVVVGGVIAYKVFAG